MILLHGLGSSLQTWDGWAERLSDAFRVVQVDLPGSGLSPPDPSGVYTDARAIELLLVLMDDLGIGRASLIGNSVGGRIAWRLAAEHPDRVERLVLVAPDGFASPGFEYGKAPELPAVLGVMRHALPEILLRQNLRPAYGDPSRLTDETVAMYHDLLRAPGARGAMIARMEQTRLSEPEPILGRITAPVLLVWGEKDAMIPSTNAEDYLRALSDVRLAAFPGLGHVPQEEAPERSLAPVREFLSP